jgi:hypothetical protein
MTYNPATDFFGLWRNNAGQVSKLEVPGLDVVIAALARAGLFTLSVSATAPVANQSTTAWLKAAVPSYSAEGALNLWDKVSTTYLPATAALFLQLLEASAGQNGVSWWTAVGGPPLNTVGNNGDFAVRTDAPNGIYGPKVLGAWPTTPVPGTADVLTSTTLDNTFGTAQGIMLYRGATLWQSLAIGAANAIMTSTGAIPAWGGLLALLDTLIGSTRGAVLYRGAAAWTQLPPGVATQVLSTNGPGADPAWTPRTAEFSSGDTLVFHQTAAPVGWTKQTAINDYGLRVTSGAVGTTAGTAFSTIFAQTTVGSTTLSTAQIPSHTHGYLLPTFPTITPGGAFPAGGSLTGGTTDGGTGGGGSHNHSINLSLSYTDVIIASKN